MIYECRNCVRQYVCRLRADFVGVMDPGHEWSLGCGEQRPLSQPAEFTNVEGLEVGGSTLTHPAPATPPTATQSGLRARL